jgi:hypothetical protein
VSIHQNPDGSLTEGVKIESNGTFISHSLQIAVASATTITTSANAAKAAGANVAVVQADGTGPFRYTLDGSTTPTSTAGVLLPANTTVALNLTDAANLKIIGGASDHINVTYTM